MNETPHVETTLLSSAHPYISKHISCFSVFVSVALVVVGIAAIILALDLNTAPSTLSMVLLTVGTIFLLIALYRLFWRSKELVYTPTGSSISEGSCYWDVSDLQELARLLEQSDFASTAPLTVKLSGNVRLDYILSKDRKFAAVQLFRFVPYVYEPVSQVYYYTGEVAEAFVHRFFHKNF